MTKSYNHLFPDFFYSASQQGWLCKTCSSFAAGAGSRTFVEKPGSLGEHPTARFTEHCQSTRHETAMKNKSAYSEMAKRDTNVWHLMRDHYLSSVSQKCSENRFVLKSFFRILHVMIKKNWTYTRNFRDIVELISVCGGNEISSHLLTSPRNATYLSPEYVGKMVTVMADYEKTPILCTLKNSEYFTFYSDETADITSIEQLALYAAFDYDNVVSEHFVGLIPISKEVGTHLSTANIMEVLECFFVNMDIPI